MRDELIKISVDTTSPEAMKALAKLKELEEEKPTAGDIGRGALTGAAVGPGAYLAAAPLTEDSAVGKAIKAVRGAAADAGPGHSSVRAGKILGNKAVRKGLKGAGMGLGAAAVSGAAYGLGLPLLRRKLDVGAEKANLRESLGQEGGGVRRNVTKTLGV
jgi:hypothetical protein